MPIYEYACGACGKTFEYTQRMSDDPKTECEACGGALERLISQTAFSLKGSGWYKDLYSSAKPSTGTSSKSEPSSSGQSAAPASTDTGKSSSASDSGKSSKKTTAAS
ncbi:MAG TPA: zinc ribbon domain-containing protein [Kofleriaceae bacterium]|nr:zinc ribbon domain-containing protein [Kofleriaceae bacterium]